MKWPEVPLGEVATVNPRKPTASELPLDAEITFVPMAAVDAESGEIVSPDLRQFGSVRDGYTGFREDDVLFAKITPCMENGKIAVARGLHQGVGFGSTEFHVLRSNGAIDPDFLHRYLRQRSFRRDAEAHMTGSVGQRRVPKDYLESVPLTVPEDVADQRAIVRLVDELDRRAWVVRERLAVARRLATRLRRAALDAAVSGVLTIEWREQASGVTAAETTLAQIAQARAERHASQSPGAGRRSRAPKPLELVTDPDTVLPEGWSACTLESLLHVGTGATPLKANAAYWNSPDVPWVTSSVVNAAVVTAPSKHVSNLALAETNLSLYPPGTLLVAMYGEGQTRGRVSELGIDAATNQALAALVFGPESEPLRPWIKLFLQNNYVAMRQSAVGGVQPNLSLKLIKAMVVPIPPVEEQQEIVSRADKLLASAAAIESQATVALHRVERLANGAFGAALSGELDVERLRHRLELDAKVEH